MLVGSSRIVLGDSLSVLKQMPSESVNCVICSPPYWALRDYGVDGQLGLESTFQEYINKLCDVFDEVKRVLRGEGTCWVNMGDTYYGGGNNRGSSPDNLSDKQFSNHGANGQVQMKWDKSFPCKSLCNIPARFSIEMQNRGWILRNRIVWHKPNVMPSSIKDRFTVDFEDVFFFVKSKRYWFETQYEPYSESYINDSRHTKGVPIHKETKDYASANVQHPTQIHDNSYGKLGVGRNKRCVWKIPTRSFKEAHFATYPPELIRPMVKAGCQNGGVILDPFFGAGTTGLVALQEGRSFIGIELNPVYVKMAEERLKPLMEQKKL